MGKQAQKWNVKTKEYVPVTVPEKATTMSFDMEEEIACASCGKTMPFGSGFTSLVIHTDIGMGYSVCPQCHDHEAEEEMKQRELR